MSKTSEALAQKKAKLQKQLEEIERKERERQRRALERERKLNKPREDRAKILLGAALLKRWATSQGVGGREKTERWLRDLCEQTLSPRDQSFMTEWLDERAHLVEAAAEEVAKKAVAAK